MSTDQQVDGLREQSRQRRLGSIRSAATSLFAEKGYEQVTTRELAQRAGVGEATLFRYFASKSELLLMVVGDQIGQLVDLIEIEDDSAPRTDGESYLARIHRVYEGRARMYVGDPENIRAFALEGLDSVSEVVRPHSMSQGDRVIALVTRILREGQDNGALRSDVDAAIVALNCNGVYVHEVIRSPVRHEDPASFPDRLRARLDVQLKPLVA